MDLKSSAFENGQRLPQKYSKEGEDCSPPLEWTGAPSEAREFALVFENTTPMTREPKLQWLAFGIPADQQGLAEGFQHQREPEEPAHIRQGTNGLGNVGYDGPLGTVGQASRFRFRLLALDQPLNLEARADEQTFWDSVSGHVVDEAVLETEWERPRR